MTRDGYLALVDATTGLHRVYYGNTEPVIGDECPGVARPNQIVGCQRYVRLTKVTEVPGGAPAATKHIPGSGGTPGKSLPIDYVVEGYLFWPLVVGERAFMERQYRNGERVDGVFRSSTITAVTETGFTTKNSEYRLEAI